MFYKPGSSPKNYPFSTPDYLRHLEDPSKIDNVTLLENQIDFGRTESKDPGNSITVISKNNGWLTVDPAVQSRKNAFEKKMRGDVHKVSLMSPSWMQTLYKPDKGEIKKFKGRVLHQ